MKNAWCANPTLQTPGPHVPTPPWEEMAGQGDDRGQVNYGGLWHENKAKAPHNLQWKLRSHCVDSDTHPPSLNKGGHRDFIVWKALAHLFTNCAEFVVQRLRRGALGYWFDTHLGHTPPFTPSSFTKQLGKNGKILLALWCRSRAFVHAEHHLRRKKWTKNNPGIDLRTEIKKITWTALTDVSWSLQSQTMTIKSK